MSFSWITFHHDFILLLNTPFIVSLSKLLVSMVISWFQWIFMTMMFEFMVLFACKFIISSFNPANIKCYFIFKNDFVPLLWNPCFYCLPSIFLINLMFLLLLEHQKSVVNSLYLQWNWVIKFLFFHHFFQNVVIDSYKWLNNKAHSIGFR